MSQYFKHAGRTLWNPANGVAALFLASAQAASTAVDLPTGLGAMVADECEIDLPVFAALTDAVVRRCRESGHPVLRALLEGFAATAVVLVERAGGNLPALSAEPGLESRDLSVGPDGVGERAAAERLAALAGDLGRAMPV
ncbi:DUF6086 family protein [Crossiella cryophila]|uniref:Uncharacterized protein n=1 Tax=Crossiella cryophila TaxID=43355 RepID=A0A7W7CJE3_9PSEU|nr:DUF6086 family protein [Crossiella cryophila]MBB4680866.1 hypothetical protein [Crossiella cryophila]